MKRNFLLLLVFVTMFVVTASAHAEVQGGTFTVSPFVGGYTFDGIQHLQTRESAGLRLGYNLSENWGVEGRFIYVPLESRNNAQTQKGNLYGVGGEVLYHFMPKSSFVPFAALGGGWMRTTKLFGPENDDATIDYGVGAKYFIADGVALRGDVRHIIAFHTSNQGATDNWQNVEYNFGLSFQFPSKPAVAPVPVAKAAEVAAPAPVEVTPAPAPAPVQPPAAGPSELVLAGRVATPSAPVAVPAPVPAPAPVPVWEGPTSWMAEKTAAPEGKVMVTGFRIVQNAFEILATGPFNYQVYTLAQPSRLVIDINNGVSGFRDNRIEINKLDIAAVRLEDNPDFLRIILDSAQENLLPYRIEETEKGLKVIVMKP